MKTLVIFVALTLSACTGVIEDPSWMSSHPDVSAPPPLDADCTGLCVGEATLTRLTRTEYRNTVRDLFGESAAGTVRVEQLPPDVAAGPFSSNEGLSFDPTWFEGYETLAVAVAGEVAANPVEVMGCDAAGADEQTCVASFVSSFGRRLFRRPVDDEQSRLYVDLWNALRDDGADSTEALEAVVTAMLASPAFVYHVEIGRETDRLGVRELDDWELASRLSFFLFRTTPDDELLALAEAGALRTPEQVEAQAEAMLRDPRFDAGLTSFHAQWLGLNGVEELEVDSETNPDFVAIRDQLGAESDRFVVHVFRESEPTLAELLTAPFSFPTPAIANYYGLDPALAADDGSVMVPMADGRAGILTQAAFLASHGDDPTTMAVHRGLAIRSDFFCQSLPPPPPVDSIISPDPELSTRQQLEEKTSSASCQGCHRLMNPVGFAFEQFDMLGRYRVLDGEHEIDATGALVDTDVSEELDGAIELGQRLAQSAEVRSCLTRQWMRFALGRSLRGHDEPSLTAVNQRYQDADFDLRAIVLAITTTDAFRHRRVPGY